MKCLNKFYVAALGLALAPATSWGLAISFLGSGPSGDGPVSAQADFTTSNGELILVLTNTLNGSIFKSPGQGLSDISFTLSNLPGALGAHTASGQFGDITGNPNPGTVTFVASDSSNGNTTPVRWYGTGGGSFTIVGSVVTLETIGGGQPSEMIAPATGNGSKYPAANAGLSNFNAWVIGPATFDLFLSGITDTTTITAVTFSFGTSGFQETSLPGTPIPENGAPEPATLGLLGLGLAALGLSRKRTR